MNDPRYQKLLETSWRRKLTPGEEAELRAWLATHPEARAAWEAEAGLNEVLGRLPEAPVPSNFTARVLQAVEREAAAGLRRRESQWSWLWHPFLPRAAMAATAFCLGLLLTGAKQKELAQKAQSVATVSRVTSLPDPEVLRDFEVIRQMNPAPPPDEELLALLK